MDTAECLKRVRERNPLVHHITNYVTVNDCANACLAVGGSPVMADALEEAADMSGISDALVLNIGTLNADKVKAMILAGKAANKKGIPVIFDPVGCGATSFRNRMAEELLKQVAKVLANNTNYATMISTPTYNGNKLKFIQLSQVDDHQLIVVIVMEGNIVKNQIVTLDEPLSNEALLKLNMLLNTSLNGTSLEQINLGVIARLKEQAGIHSGVMSSVLDAVANVIQLDDDMEIYTSGATNIFKYPELSDKQSAQEIISAFEEKQQLAALVTKSMANGGEDRDIQVYIGDESNVENMKDCSVVTATYELGEGMQGTIGIIGPKRMDYEHVMKTLKTLMAELDDIFHRDEPKKLE